MEFFIHAEDIRRAAPGWEPAALSEDLHEALWSKLARTARVNGRRSPVGLVLRLADGRTAVARPGAPVATVTGNAGELVLFASGRQAHSVVEIEGDEATVAAARRASLGI